MSLGTLWEFLNQCKSIRNKRIRQILLDEGLNYLHRCDLVMFTWERIDKALGEVFSKEGEEMMAKMTFGQMMAKEDGIELGREERDQEIALRMLADGENIAKIASTPV